jgi:hypothetical protein
MTARFNRNCERLTSAMIYTDDLAALACGIDRLVRFLILWTRVVDALEIRMAASHKRVISQQRGLSASVSRSRSVLHTFPRAR